VKYSSLDWDFQELSSLLKGEDNLPSCMYGNLWENPGTLFLKLEDRLSYKSHIRMISNNRTGSNCYFWLIFSHLTILLDIRSECNQLTLSTCMLRKEDCLNERSCPSRICNEEFLHFESLQVSYSWDEWLNLRCFRPLRILRDLQSPIALLVHDREHLQTARRVSLK